MANFLKKNGTLNKQGHKLGHSFMLIWDIVANGAGPSGAITEVQCTCLIYSRDYFSNAIDPCTTPFSNLGAVSKQASTLYHRNFRRMGSCTDSELRLPVI